MRLYTDGWRVIRVHTDLTNSHDDFLLAPAETYQFDTGSWAERSNLTSRIVFTGDWTSCSEEESSAILSATAASLQ